MMDTIYICLSLVVAYLVGSIPTAVWVGRRFYGKDVRQFGSGNAGATNTFRVLGKRAGIFVLSIDILKGWAATSITFILLQLDIIIKPELLYFELLFGIIAVLGHIFPIYVGFKGGKGVATLFGVVLAIYFQVALLSVGIFLVVLLVWHYVSLGSILAAVSYPLWMFIPEFQPSNPVLNVIGFLLCVLVIWTHRQNIHRLMDGSESKIYLFKRK